MGHTNKMKNEPLGHFCFLLWTSLRSFRMMEKKTTVGCKTQRETCSEADADADAGGSCPKSLDLIFLIYPGRECDKVLF